MTNAATGWMVGQLVYYCTREKRLAGSVTHRAEATVEKVGRKYVTVQGEQFHLGSGRGAQYPARWIERVDTGA